MSSPARKNRSSVWHSHTLLLKVLQSSRRRSGANKVRFVFAAACTSQKAPCAGLGPKELASADPTVDVGPAQCRSPAKARSGARAFSCKRACPLACYCPPFTRRRLSAQARLACAMRYSWMLRFCSIISSRARSAARLGAVGVDLLGALGRVDEDEHVAALHLDKAGGDGQSAVLRAVRRAASAARPGTTAADRCCCGGRGCRACPRQAVGHDQRLSHGPS